MAKNKIKQVKFINKENLRIARENMGLDSLSATKKISISKKNLVSEWESGKSLPTWSQVNKLSKIYDISELLFFVKNKITKTKELPDYRVGNLSESNFRVKKTINLFIKRQWWLEKKLKGEGALKNTIQGSGKKFRKPEELASYIRRSLNIELEDIKKISGQDSRKRALKYLIEKTEEVGIFVGKTISYISIDVNHMRGLFISNDYCPYIILNRRDSASAQIFSFAHELAHLFRKSDSISNIADFRQLSSKVNSEEVFCNKVAAELLLPSNKFKETYYSKNDIDEISMLYKVSKLFIFYRLKSLNKIRNNEIKKIEKEIMEEIEKYLLDENKKNKNEGGNYVYSMKDSNGNLFNNYIASAYSANKIDYVEASNLLKCSVEKI